ncbi:MAG: hypothetical protein O8C67_07200 [Candidatus Methanoperedens sp.]|nr:hypothetical protein [Candidatus Methanoperedens sp.]
MTQEEQLTELTDIWRKLKTDEEQMFRRWARDNWKYNTEPNPLWHPVVRDEWSKLDEEERDVLKFWEMK